MAVSADSISASVPSPTALATSVASARVGVGADTIDSSICVAVSTGRPRAPQARMMRFCRWGTSSIGQVDAQVAAGHHDAVGHVEQLVEVGRPRPGSRSWP